VFEKRPRCGSFDGDGCEIRLLEAVEIDKPLAGAAAADRYLDPTGTELLGDRMARAAWPAPSHQ